MASIPVSAEQPAANAFRVAIAPSASVMWIGCAALTTAAGCAHSRPTTMTPKIAARNHHRYYERACALRDAPQVHGSDQDQADQAQREHVVDQRGETPRPVCRSRGETDRDGQYVRRRPVAMCGLRASLRPDDRSISITAYAAPEWLAGRIGAEQDLRPGAPEGEPHDLKIGGPVLPAGTCPDVRPHWSSCYRPDRPCLPWLTVVGVGQVPAAGGDELVDGVGAPGSACVGQRSWRLLEQRR
jgi:hypothetical protein